MKQKILKLIKILNKFTIDDILSMDDFEEQEVSEHDENDKKQKQEQQLQKFNSVWRRGL